ncbi:MAG: YhjD/YihY/BrkB family envelope integrity protein, partial [Longimicrobiales bacterium]|nr:YhjD/YihY/BrkB family envelope integrity protein [Longimicrobiales bacterium]
MSEQNEEAGPGRRLLRIALRTAREWQEDDAIRWGAAIAYYSVISLAPLVVLATTILGRVVADDRAERWVLDQVSILAGPQAADVAATVIEETTRLDLASVGSILSLLLLLLGATAVFANL